MNKLEILKKIGKVGLNLAGVQAGAGKDKVRALEAEKELLELKLALARQALEDAQRLILEASRMLDPNTTVQFARLELSGKLVEAAHETAEALEVIGRAE